MKKICLLYCLFAVFSDAFAALSAKSYIQEGLIAHWDGIENVGYGKAHDNAATKWTELTGNGPDITNPSGSTVVDDGLTVVRASGTTVDKANAKKILDAYCSGNYTAEVVFDKTKATPVSSNGYKNKICVMLMFGRAYSWMGTFGDTQMGINPMKSGGEGNLNGGTYITAETTLGRHSLSCSQAGSESIVRADRDLIGRKTVTVGTQDRAHGFGFNRAYYQDYGLDGIYHTIRIYNRALTKEEVAVNYAIDQVRYNDASASDVALPEGWRFTTDSGDVKLEKWLSVEVKNKTGGTVAVNGDADGVWCEYGKTVEVSLSAVPAEGYYFVGWSGVEGAGKYSLSTTAVVGDKVTAVFRKIDRTDSFAYSWSGSSSDDWYDPENWKDSDGLKGVPVDGDYVSVPAGATLLLTNSTPQLASLAIAGTLVATNWTTCISAGNVEILSGGSLKCASAVAEERDLSRVWIKCGDLTVAAGGKIDVSGRGYRGGVMKTNGERGYGPGSGYFPGGGSAGSVFQYEGTINAAPSHGGCGAHYIDVNTRSVKSALPYDNPAAPELPGSGGYSTTWGAGGSGGGAVLIEADARVTVDGSILADGGDNNNDYRASPGSGGSIRIVCSSIAGSGLISAQGGDGYSMTAANYALPAGGGCISIEYDSEIQESSAVVGMKIDAGSGVYGRTGIKSRTAEYSDWRDADPGTLHFTDTKILDTLLGNGLSGAIKGCPVYERDSDLAMLWGYVRFADEAVSIRIGGDLAISGDGVRLEIGAVAATNRTAIVTLYGGDRASRLSISGDMTLTGASRFDVRAATTNITEKFGAFVSVGGTLTIGTNAAVFAWSDQITPSSPFFEVGNLHVATGGVFSASRRGGAGGINQHACVSYRKSDLISVQACGLKTKGAGHGGAGGGGSDTSSAWGVAYDDAHRPWLPGSGAGSYNDYSIGGNGGGAVIVAATNGFIRIDGTVSADGENGGWASRSHGFGGGGAGGTILLECKVFTGSETGKLSAQGGTTTPELSNDGSVVVSCGAGGGGRIAVWCGSPWTGVEPKSRITSAVEFLGSDYGEWFSYKGMFSAAGGVAKGAHAVERNHGKDGTVYFHHVKAPPKDLTLRVR